jgi:hypothetical protein
VFENGSVKTGMFSTHLWGENLKSSEDGPKEPPTEIGIAVDSGDILVEEHWLIREGCRFDPVKSRTAYELLEVRARWCLIRTAESNRLIP